MQINVAWDVLGDSEKRRSYDISTLGHSAVPTDSHHKASQSTNPPQPHWQPPRSNTTSQEDAKAQAESQKKRQEWLDFERVQEQSIRQCRTRAKTLEADIAKFNLKIEENRTKLANDVPYWWNVLASMSPRLSEADKNELRRQNLDSDAAIRIKRVPLASERQRLQQLESELARRQTQENVRVARERQEKERKERLEREKAQAEAQRRWEEQAAKKRAEMEANMKAANERFAKEQAARQKKAAEEHAAMQAERARKKKQADADRERIQKLARERTAAAKAEAERNKSRGQPCRHRMWWDKIEGARDCGHCTKPLYKFALQCRGCQTIGCAECMRTLKAGRTPAIDHGSKGRRNKSNNTRPSRGKNSYGYEEPFSPPSLPNTSSYDDSYDWYD